MPGIVKLHDSGPILFAGSGTFQLNGVESMSIDPGLKTQIETGTGVVDPSYIGVMTNEPTINATCTDIATALSNGIGLNGLSILSTGTITGATFYFTAMVEGGTRAGTLSHFSTAMTKGMVVPKSISVSQGQRATMSFDVHAIYDGTNAPITFADSVTITTAPVVSELFTLGPVEINGTEVNSVTGLEIDFGLEVVKESATGQPYPSYIAIKSRNPKITVTTKDMASLNTFGMAGTAQGGTPSVCYLQKMVNNGVRVAAATAQHIKLSLSASQGLIYNTSYGGNRGNSQEGKIMIMPQGGSAAILTISTTSAIS